MSDHAWDALVEIFKAAIVSPLGVAGLVVLGGGFVVLSLVRSSRGTGVRILAVLILFVFYGVVVGISFYAVRPVGLPSGAAKAVETEISPRPLQTPAAPLTAASPTPAAVASPVASAHVRVDCGTYWTGWFNMGGGVGNPCPAGCTRGDRTGVTFRAVGFPPRPQAKYKFQCWRLP